MSATATIDAAARPIGHALSIDSLIHRPATCVPAIASGTPVTSPVQTSASALLSTMRIT